MAQNDASMVMAGLNSIADMRLRQEMLKRQTMKDEEEKQLRQRMLSLQEEDREDRRRAGLRNELMARERMLASLRNETARVDAQADQIERQNSADAWSRSAANPVNQERTQRVALLKAQIEATKAKPTTPIGAQVKGVDEYAEQMAAALEENQQALAAAQSGDPTARARALKSQLKLSGLQELGKQMVKTGKAEPDVDIEIPGPIDPESGKPQGSVKMKVPMSQWNQQHPLWARFNRPQGESALPAAGNSMPAPKNKAERDALPPGTKYRGPDGQTYIR